MLMFKNRYKIIIIVGIVASFFVYAFLESYWLRVTRFDFQSPDVPEAFASKKIVFVSDLHLGFYFSNKRTKKLVEKINQLQPDIIIFGGDFIDRNIKYTEPRFDGLKDLRASLGKFGVLGNHDNAISAKAIGQEMKDAGIINLDNQAEWIWASSSDASTSAMEKIKIGGVGDLWTATQDLGPTLAGVNKQDFVILLSHDPDFITKFDSQDIDFVLSGHTHAGQLTLFGLWGFAPCRSYHNQNLRYGLTNVNGHSIYISSGVGATILPLRFFARPEIVLVTLKR